MKPKPVPTADAVQPLTADEEAVVRSLPGLIYALPRAIDAEMMREQRLSNTEYLALMHLSEAPDRQLRMHELAHACEMSLSGTSRVVQRLESEGFVQRLRCDQDGRSWHASLTDAGLTRLEEAWPTNLAAIRRHFLDHLEGLDLKTLAAALRNVATRGTAHPRAGHDKRQPADPRPRPPQPSGPRSSVASRQSSGWRDGDAGCGVPHPHVSPRAHRSCCEMSHQAGHRNH